jgi:hypothetical protein
MTPKKLQIFVSSTYSDLREERQAAVQAIVTAGHIPAGMELFAAGDQSQMDVIKRWIDESDVFLLILGGRYGSIEPVSNKSYIQLEYEYALQKNKAFFAVVIDEDHLKEKVRLHGSDVIETDNAKELKTFRAMVLTRLVKFWSDTKDIELAVHRILSEFARRDELVGWVSGKHATDTGALAEEIARLGKENASLRAQISKAGAASPSFSLDELVRGWKDNPGTLKILKERASSDPSEDVRWAAVQQLACRWKDEPDTLKILKARASGDPSWGVRWAAAQQLARSWKDDPDTVKILKERATNDRYDDVREAAMVELARNWRDDPDTVKILKERATSDEQEHVRKGAVQELLRGWSEDIDVTEWLARIGNIR